MNKIAIFVKPSQDPRVIQVIQKLIELTKNEISELRLEQERKSLLGQLQNASNCSFKNNDEILREIDGIITLGGDGTLLGAIRSTSLHHCKAPILSFNLGKLGFNTEFNLSELENTVSQFISGKLPLISKKLFEVELACSNKKKSFCFFNDVVISRNDISRMFSLDILCQNDLLYQLSGDGVIISSPVGSTAYSLAAGGPIVHPGVESLIITPICPHSLNQRSVVVPDRSPITIRFPQASSVIMTLDGQEIVELDNKMKVTISCSNEHAVLMAQNPNASYFKKLADKFINGL